MAIRINLLNREIAPVLKKREWFRKYSKKWRLDNLEKVREQGRAAAVRWRASNAEQHRQEVKSSDYDWAKRYPDRAKLKGRRRHLRDKYGMSIQDYDRMLQAQGGLCKICQEPPRIRSFLVVDHCHKSGKVRALLCQPCNIALGYFQDNIPRVLAAAAYLQEHSEATPDEAVPQAEAPGATELP